MNHSQFPVARPTRRDDQALSQVSEARSVGQLIDQALANLTPQQVESLSEKAANEALRLQVKMREQQMDYVAGKKTIEDHIDTFEMLDKTGRTTRQKVETTVNTGAGTMRIESKSGATCFVASVAYQDPNHPDVMFLRWVRDCHLRQHNAGRRFIDWYWRTGPKIARVVERWEFLRRPSRLCLMGLVAVLRLGFRN